MSLSSPYSTEQVADAAFEQLIGALCKRPGMYVSEPTLATVCAYLEGYDAANCGGPLVGLHQWLVLRAEGGNNIAWSAHAERLIREGRPSLTEAAAIIALGELLMTFIHFRRDHGLTKIFYDYAKWLLRKSWYAGPLRSARPRTRIRKKA